jgi:hypothetical protein
MFQLLNSSVILVMKVNIYQKTFRIITFHRNVIQINVSIPRHHLAQCVSMSLLRLEGRVRWLGRVCNYVCVKV